MRAALDAKTLAVLGALAAAGSASAAPLSTSLTVTGDVLDPATYDAAALAALPQVSESVSYTAAGTPVSAVFAGPTLQSLVAAAMIDTDLSARNAVVPYYLTATGSDGYRVVYALAEIDPRFAGGGASPPLVATSVNGGSLGSAGFARTTAPRDAAGGRYDSNLVNLDIERASPIGPLPSGGGASTGFTLSGEVTHPGTYTLSNLLALPATTVTTTYQGRNGSVTASYKGTSLWGLLTAAGIVTNPAVKNDILDKYVDVIGTDGYQSVVSLGEIDPAFGDQPDIIAYGENGGGLGSSGFAELIVPGDLYGGRYTFNIAEIEVLDSASPDAVPEPDGLLPLAPALAALTGWSLLRRPSSVRRAARGARSR
jgi:DMSO/TMAO reductase YedYZ molybdopterin-dependent catalytic subunit